MKGAILLLVLFTAFFIRANAQIHNKYITVKAGEKISMPQHRVGNGRVVQNINPGFVKVGHSQRFLPQKFNSYNSSTINIPYRATVSSALTSVPSGLIGTFQFKGVSYFTGGYITGETVIRADNLDPKKIWIKNLIPGASNKEVYGTISTDQKIISIPQGQQIYVAGSDKATLTIYNSTKPISGQFDATTGVINITSDFWGAVSTDGFLELLSGPVTYTRTDMLPPFASYRQPSGGLFLGLDPDTWDGYISTCLVNPPFVTWNWRNNKIEKDVAYSWSCTDSISNKNITSNIDSLLMDVDDSYYNTPKLLATNTKGFSSSFVLGADFKNKGNSSFSLAGGNGAMLDFNSTCDYGVANLDYGFTYFENGIDSYFFGTGASQFSGTDNEALLVYYEKPLSTLYFEGVNVYLFVFEAPANTTFTMNVVLAEKNDEGHSVKGKVIARSEIQAKDVITIKNDFQEVVGYTMKFTEFQAIDESGFEVTTEYIETDKAFYLELTGFNVPGVKLAACTEEINPVDSTSRSCFMVKGDPSIYYWENFRQTMYFNLAGMAYSYISLSDNSIFDEKSGGTYSVEATPFFDTLYFDKALVPNWLKVEITDEEYSDSIWGATVKVKIDPLPANGDPRVYDLVLNTVAATRVLHINQACQVSKGEIKNTPLASAFKNEQGFMIKYPREMNTLSVYSATGAFVGRYKLPHNGSYQLNGSTLTSGLYILKLQGLKRVETIKVVKD